VTDAVAVEATGETVGEAKWHALRELELRYPGIDRSAVQFQVVTEGERGLLGVGTSPARVIATVDPDAAAAPPVAGEGTSATVFEVVDRISRALGVHCRVDVVEDEDTVTATCSGAELGLLIGKHGQTIDAIQYLVNAIVHREAGEGRKEVVVDAAGYRERRLGALEAVALRAARRALDEERAVELEPMSAVERKAVHLRLKDYPGVETTSEGAEPHRYVVVAPSRA
jgi:spoIIIJ-associated protein